MQFDLKIGAETVKDGTNTRLCPGQMCELPKHHAVIYCFLAPGCFIRFSSPHHSLGFAFSQPFRSLSVWVRRQPVS